MNPVNLKSWAALIRFPNVFTVIADVSAAFFLVLGGSGWSGGVLNRDGISGSPGTIWGVFALALVSAISLYWAGMVLNDVFDIRRDARARSNRPLPSRAISLRAARLAGWGLLLLGIVPAIGIGLCGETRLGWVPVSVTVLLALSIVLYDGPCKRTALAPVLMGLCRTFSFLLGATAANAALAKVLGVDTLAENQSVALGSPLGLGLTPVVLAFALGMGTYITGITTFGRREAIGDRTIHLPIGFVVMTVGALLLALAPATAGLAGDIAGDAWKTAWRIDPVVIFPAAILMMLSIALFRAFSAARAPSPLKIQGTIKSALLAIIPLAAAITMLAVGAIIAALVFALLLPSRWLASRFQMT